MMTYYFDVLPLHPRPEYLESLTSYLMRLGQLNGISSIDGLSALCFPHQDRRITRDIADYPPVSFDDLTRVGAWSEEILRTTTFFHLAAKFGRSTLPQPMSRFLSGCIGQHLRYCPVCFAEQRVRCYLLTWRFLMVTCCCKHKCRLLETCGDCGELIPLYTACFKLGTCPRCQYRLKLCAASVLDEGELKMASYIHDDIIFLLTPQPWEADGSSVIKRVGRQLSHMRKVKRLTAVEAASQVGVTLTVVEGIERGDFQGKGAPLQSYFKYAHYLCLSLKEIFSEVVGGSADRAPATPLPLCPVCQQSYYVTRDGYNRSSSQRYQCQHCRHSFTALPKVRQVKRRSS